MSKEILASLEGKPPQPQPWIVERRNDSGYTPKVDIHDATGQKYVLKFDPAGARERNSGSERIGTLIMHAVGYNVPHNSIVYFRLEDLKFDEKSYYDDPMGKRRPLTSADVEAVLKKLAPMPDGRYRGIASLRLAGTAALGPFMFTGRRKDDKNDIIPHELRRELRGLRVISAWINHVDIKDNQALDMYQTAPNGRKFVKRCLIDFSATLAPTSGRWRPIASDTSTCLTALPWGSRWLRWACGVAPGRCEEVVEHPEVGYFSSELFEPDKWKPSFPNRAFDQMEDGDGYWGAKIVTAFSDELIHRIVAAGEYSRPEVTDYVETVLKKRRDAVGAYWLNRVTPLEDIRLEGNRLQFRDLAAERGFADARSRDYRFHLENLDGKRLAPDQIAGTVVIPSASQLPSPAAEQPADRHQRRPLLRVIIQSRRNQKEWALPVEVVLGRVGTSNDLQVLGWTHAPD